jgi:hypothetical protein
MTRLGRIARWSTPRAIRSRSSKPRCRSRLGKRLFCVTTLATLIPDPGCRDLRGLVRRLQLQRGNRGRSGRFGHNGVAGWTLLHHLPQVCRTLIGREPWPHILRRLRSVGAFGGQLCPNWLSLGIGRSAEPLRRASFMPASRNAGTLLVVGLVFFSSMSYPRVKIRSLRDKFDYQSGAS